MEALSLRAGVVTYATTASAAQPYSGLKANHLPNTRMHRVEDGVSVFYQEAGRVDAPVILLLQGSNTSSFQYRNLLGQITVLAEQGRLKSLLATEQSGAGKIAQAYDLVAKGSKRQGGH